MSKTFQSAALAAIALFALAGQAFAHAHLQSATPAVDGTVAAAPTELDLNFSEDLNLKFSGVKVTGPGKAAVATGEPMLMNKNATLMVPLSGTLGAGVYTVSWHALSADGHKTHGSYKFTVKP
ncbi:copper homeostasis periplasmic binding protein CopC [Labrys monachus]|uniref:Methionine-rich copper-binding protein CopC n=1 Tax=Labrys monachus TaxID=217067 RepID=A0ABU0FF25_9HYPH|nr:copper homeostasis periplasmic binding protein CopC [Labrys monachus]MDQ0392703.1 methionine-rich copper-binding protein CopC [Labrys monachus]